MKSKRNGFVVIVLLFVFGMCAQSSSAGEINGKVTAQGMRSPENIAVYVDAILGKSFPAPTQTQSWTKRV